MLAVYSEDSTRARVHLWLDGSQNLVERVQPSLVEAAFVKGETRNLWLRGTHTRRTSRPDSKVLAGLRLQDALTPVEDGSFALNSVRSRLPDAEAGRIVRGGVGATPAKALVWSGPTVDFTEFAQGVEEIFAFLEAARAGGTAGPDILSVLMRPVDDIDDASGAYDLSVPSPDEVAAAPDATDAQVAAAELLEEAILDVTGEAGSNTAVLTVGRDGSSVGQISCSVSSVRSGIAFRFGTRGTPTDYVGLQEIREALDESGDLVTVYYRSGHTIDSKGAYLEEVRTLPFRHWDHQDFSGYHIDREKPSGGAPQDIHDAVGRAGDRSLFAWVVAHYTDGWLTCDDGSGEIADFVHLDPAGAVSLIHVKGASSRSAGRLVAVSPHEIVTSQAAKNMVYRDKRLLLRHLSASRVDRPASWSAGQRVADRTDLLDMLQCTDASDPLPVIVVQPHVSKQVRERALATAAAGGSDDLFRLHRLEALLNVCNGAVSALGAEFAVISSLV